MQFFEKMPAGETDCGGRLRPERGLRGFGFGAAGLLGLLVVLAATAGVHGTQEGGPTGETIVYSSIQPANWDLYLFDGPASEPRRLTTDPGLDYNGAISPDGRWVVFTSERRGNPDLYVLDLEGDAGPRPLVESPALEDAAAISPDGEQLLFVGTRDGNASFAIPFGPRPVRAGRGVNLKRARDGRLQRPFARGGRIVSPAAATRRWRRAPGPAPRRPIWPASCT